MKMILSAFILSVSFSAQAFSCNGFIQKANRMESQIMRSGDGGPAQQDAVLAMYDDFNKIPTTDSCRPDAFRALMNASLARVAYDGESEVQQMVVKKLATNPELESIYESALSQFSDQCRSQRFSLIVTEIQNQNAHRPQKPYRFNFEQCEAGKSGKLEKKSPNEIAAQPCPDSPHQPTGVGSSFFDAFRRALSPQSQLDSTSSGSNGFAQTATHTKTKVGAPLQPSPRANSRRPASLEPPIYEAPDENSTAQ